MGYLMDRWGARLGLSAAVLWWSAATGAQVCARSGLQFGVTRFWMGTGECGNYSGGMKTVTRLFGKKERTLAIGANDYLTKPVSMPELRIALNKCVTARRAREARTIG